MDNGNIVTPQSRSKDTFIHLSKDNRYDSEVKITIHGIERTVQVYQDIEATYRMDCPICLSPLDKPVFCCSDYTHLACRLCAEEYVKSVFTKKNGCWVCRRVRKVKDTASLLQDATKQYKAWKNYLPLAPYFCPNDCRTRPVGTLDSLKEHFITCSQLTCFDCKVKYSDSQSLLNHQEQCPDQYITCKACKIKIQRKELEQHTSTTCPEVEVNQYAPIVDKSITLKRKHFNALNPNNKDRLAHEISAAVSAVNSLINPQQSTHVVTPPAERSKQETLSSDIIAQFTFSPLSPHVEWSESRDLKGNKSYGLMDFPADKTTKTDTKYYSHVPTDNMCIFLTKINDSLTGLFPYAFRRGSGPFDSSGFTEESYKSNIIDHHYLIAINGTSNNESIRLYSTQFTIRQIFENHVHSKSGKNLNAPEILPSFKDLYHFFCKDQAGGQYLETQSARARFTIFISKP